MKEMLWSILMTFVFGVHAIFPLLSEVADFFGWDFSCLYVRTEELDLAVYDFAERKATAEPAGSDDYNTGNGAIYLEDVYSTQYFYNLRDNLGYNLYGSCAYIAIGMILSFYDTYWDDDIIVDDYETNTEIETATLNDAFREEEAPSSPGATNDYAIMTSMSSYNMYEYIYTYNQSYLQYYLIYLARYNGLADIGYPLSASSFGLTFSETIYVLYQYLVDNDLTGIKLRYVANFQVDSKISSNDIATDADVDIEEFVTENLVAGTPVMLKLQGTSSAHMVIAYDYDESASSFYNGIYVHPGWFNTSSTNTHVSLGSLNYSEITAALALDVSGIAHSCGNNYYYGTKSFCSCVLGCHLEHTHVASQYEEYDEYYHSVTCRNCNACVLQSHSLTGVQYDGWMCSYCPSCGYRKQLYEIGV